MSKKSLMVVLVLVLCARVALADGVSMRVNQSEFYFNVGEDAIIPIVINNTYGKEIGGMLSYTVTQEISQAGFYYSSSSTNSRSVSFEPGVSAINLNFGTSNAPTTLRVGLSFTYDGTKREVLPEFVIHFVLGNTTQPISRPLSSTSQTIAQQPSIRRSTQQIFNQIFGNTKATTPQSNILSQDMNALKSQIQKQLQEQQSLEENFKQAVAQNSDVQKAHHSLIEEGFNMTNARFNPLSNNTGTFELSYRNKSGAEARVIAVSYTHLTLPTKA